MNAPIDVLARKWVGMTFWHKIIVFCVAFQAVNLVVKMFIFGAPIAVAWILLIVGCGFYVWHTAVSR